jgi:hypothetical protein
MRGPIFLSASNAKYDRIKVGIGFKIGPCDLIINRAELRLGRVERDHQQRQMAADLVEKHPVIKGDQTGDNFCRSVALVAKRVLSSPRPRIPEPPSQEARIRSLRRAGAASADGLTEGPDASFRQKLRG